jgi:hypothetical protein
MSFETGNLSCEHEWVEYDDSAAYNDGFNFPTVAICNRCGAQQDIRYKYAGVNKLKWYENLLLLPFSIIVIFYLFTIAPILMIVGFIKDEFASKKAG